MQTSTNNGIAMLRESANMVMATLWLLGAGGAVDAHCHGFHGAPCNGTCVAARAQATWLLTWCEMPGVYFPMRPCTSKRDNVVRGALPSFVLLCLRGRKAWCDYACMITRQGIRTGAGHLDVEVHVMSERSIILCALILE